VQELKLFLVVLVHLDDQVALPVDLFHEVPRLGHATFSGQIEPV
jgi:hypothetical protein